MTCASVIAPLLASAAASPAVSAGTPTPRRRSDFSTGFGGEPARAAAPPFPAWRTRLRAADGAKPEPRA